MEILFWLLPSAVVTVLAMLFVAWLARERHDVDNEVAIRRLGKGLSRPFQPRYVARPHDPEHSTGVTVRSRSSASEDSVSQGRI